MEIDEHALDRRLKRAAALINALPPATKHRFTDDLQRALAQTNQLGLVPRRRRFAVMVRISEDIEHMMRRALNAHPTGQRNAQAA